jgi:hypothetical protein
MKNEALSRNLPPDGYEGGLILDEMSIQRDGNVYVWGFKEVTDESQFIDSILSGKKEIKLATHVLQYESSLPLLCKLFLIFFIRCE